MVTKKLFKRFVQEIVSYQKQIPINYSIPEKLHRTFKEQELILSWTKADNDACKLYPGSRQDDLYFKCRIELFYQYSEKCLTDAI